MNQYVIFTVANHRKLRKLATLVILELKCGYYKHKKQNKENYIYTLNVSSSGLTGHTKALTDWMCKMLCCRT